MFLCAVKEGERWGEERNTKREMQNLKDRSARVKSVRF